MNSKNRPTARASTAATPTATTPTTALTDVLTALLQQFPEGTTIEIRDGVPVYSEPPALAPSVALRKAMANVQEPKRQSKARTMPRRRVYRVAEVQSAILIAALQSSVASSQVVLNYLIEHPRSTVAQLADALDLKQKTVENQLGDLRKRGLVIAEDAHR